MIVPPPSILGTQVKYLCLWTDVCAVDKQLCGGDYFFLLLWCSGVCQPPQRWHSGTLPMLFTAAVITENSFVRLDTYPTCLSRKALIQRGESGDVLEVGRLGEGDVPHFWINADANRKLILLCVRWGIGRWEGAAATSDECKIYIHSQARLQPKGAPITVFTQSFICRAKSGHAVPRKTHTHVPHTHRRLWQTPYRALNCQSDYFVLWGHRTELTSRLSCLDLRSLVH